MLTPQFTIPLHNELVVDLFAGGGGASTGIEKAIGRPVDIAINRDPVVFVAICKHWGITTQFRQNAAVLCHDDFSVDYVPSDSIEKAAALLVIDLVKRGVK